MQRRKLLLSWSLLALLLLASGLVDWPACVALLLAQRLLQ